jgi:hypothetical protein
MTADLARPCRRFQFSLRLALLLMTLACVIASYVGWRIYKAKTDYDSWSMGPDPYARERNKRAMAHDDRFDQLPPLPPWPPLKRGDARP